MKDTGEIIIFGSTYTYCVDRTYGDYPLTRFYEIGKTFPDIFVTMNIDILDVDYSKGQLTYRIKEAFEKKTGRSIRNRELENGELINEII